MSSPVILQHVSQLDNVTWDTADAYNYILTDTTVIWKVYIPSHISKISKLWPVLTIGEQEKASRYHREADKQRFIIGKAYLRFLLSKYLQTQPYKIEFDTNKNGKPHLKSPPGNIHYNVSHSGDYVLIAMCTEEVGIDVEQLNPDVHYVDIMEISFSPDEIAYVNNAQNPILNFYKIWTRKEALLKATGTGIDDSIKNMPGLDGDYAVIPLISLKKNCFSRTFALGEKHIATITNYKKTMLFLSIS